MEEIGRTHGAGAIDAAVERRRTRHPGVLGVDDHLRSYCKQQHKQHWYY